VRFLIDMPVALALADRLMQQGHDAVHASHVALAFAPDTTILHFAAGESRVLVTVDLDSARLPTLGRFRDPGLILFRGGNYSEQEVRDLLGRALQNSSRVRPAPQRCRARQGVHLPATSPHHARQVKGSTVI
jgi:predicted nuclease of predicted toxin-antitoxin system